MLGVAYEVWWPLNRYCQIPFQDLLLRDDLVFNKNKSDVASLKRFVFLGEDPFVKDVADSYINPEEWFFRSTLISTLKDALKYKDYLVVFFPKKIPQYRREVGSQFLDLKFCTPILERFQMECSRLQLHGRYWGLHIRGSDATHSKAYYWWWLQVSRFLPGRVFLCSDDECLIKLFKTTSCAIVVRDAIALPSKSDESLDWKDVTVDENLQRLPYNIYRSRESIVDAAVDLMMLASSNIVITSRSTFLDVAISLSRRKSPLIYFIHEKIEYFRFIGRFFREKVKCRRGKH